MTNTIIPHDHHHHPRLHPEREQQAPVMKPPQMTKKQARRRTHASRPYQERLLNMAEARREIVTALKIHRANMMRQQHPYQHYEPPPPPPPICQSPMMQLRRHEQQQQQQTQVVFQYQDQNQAIGEEAPPTPATSYASFAGGGDTLAHWIAAAGDAPAGSQSHYCSSSPFLPFDDLTPLEVPATAMGGGLEQLARSLPAQPLGLNLSFQGFGDSMDGAEVCDGDLFGSVPLIQSSLLSSAASSYYSPAATDIARGAHGSPAFISTAEDYSPAPASLILPVLDDGEKQSACETQGETTGADVTAASAWWSKILFESMESGAGGEVAEGGVAVGCTVEDVAAASSLPAEWRWLCDDRGVDEQGAVVKEAADQQPDVLETMLAGGDYYTFCYSDEGGRRGSDSIILPCMDDDILEGGTGSTGSHAHHHA